MPQEKNLCVLIPAYNEAGAIGRLIKTIKEFGFDVMVVDDGSTDATSDIARSAGALVIRHDVNKGKGVSIQEGIRYALANSYNAMVIMDGDGQHKPEEIHQFIQKADEKKSSFITGNRMRNTAGMPVIRLITNRVMSAVISAICRQHIPDTQCGFKFIRRDALEKLNLSSSRYDIETEILIEAAMSGIKIDSIPIRTIYQREESKIRPVIDTLRFMRLLIKKIFAKRT